MNGSEDFIIIACDGLWDTVSPMSATKCVYKQLQTDKGKFCEKYFSISFYLYLAVSNRMEYSNRTKLDRYHFQVICHIDLRHSHRRTDRQNELFLSFKLLCKINYNFNGAILELFRQTSQTEIIIWKIVVSHNFRSIIYYA